MQSRKKTVIPQTGFPYFLFTCLSVKCGSPQKPSYCLVCVSALPLLCVASKRNGGWRSSLPRVCVATSDQSWHNPWRPLFVVFPLQMDWGGRDKDRRELFRYKSLIHLPLFVLCRCGSFCSLKGSVCVLPFLILPYFTLLCLTLPGLTSPHLSLRYLISPPPLTHLTSPYILTLPFLTLLTSHPLISPHLTGAPR